MEGVSLSLIVSLVYLQSDFRYAGVVRPDGASSTCYPSPSSWTCLPSFHSADGSNALPGCKPQLHIETETTDGLRYVSPRQDPHLVLRGADRLRKIIRPSLLWRVLKEAGVYGDRHKSLSTSVCVGALSLCVFYV